MPQKTVFIRDEDIPKWNLIGRKSQWVHDALNTEEGVVRPIGQRVDKVGTDIVDNNLEKPGVSGFVPRPPDPKSGYPCCTRKSPCKHWQWDSDDSIWVNVITGARRETG